MVARETGTNVGGKHILGYTWPRLRCPPSIDLLKLVDMMFAVRCRELDGLKREEVDVPCRETVGWLRLTAGKVSEMLH